VEAMELLKKDHKYSKMGVNVLADAPIISIEK
jgi:hypothetical protein